MNRGLKTGQQAEGHQSKTVWFRMVPYGTEEETEPETEAEAEGGEGESIRENKFPK